MSYDIGAELQRAYDEGYKDGYKYGKEKYRKQGKWEVTNGGGESMTFWYKCSECGGAGDAQDRYCKHCGAKMEVE